MLNVRVRSITWEAPNVLSYELVRPDGAELPAFTAGAHIDLKLANKMARSYSLMNSQSERNRYVIAVQKDRQSRGGSKWIHQNIRAGEIISVEGPRNNFVLDETANMSVFLAGGIGITPILGMIDRLNEIGRSWQLTYCSRTRALTPFLRRLEADPRVRFNFDHEAGGEILDIGEVVRSVPSGAHLYCCGPIPMLQSFELATKDIDPERRHVEYFSATEPPATEGGFTVVLARSGREVPIPQGKTILATLQALDIELPCSCIEGVCGTCETTVLGGIPDHRDRILTDRERAANKKIMICCSGSKSDRLVLDL